MTQISNWALAALDLFFCLLGELVALTHKYWNFIHKLTKECKFNNLQLINMPSSMRVADNCLENHKIQLIFQDI
jgi:hypothetical protein